MPRVEVLSSLKHNGVTLEPGTELELSQEDIDLLPPGAVHILGTTRIPLEVPYRSVPADAPPPFAGTEAAHAAYEAKVKASDADLAARDVITKAREDATRGEVEHDQRVKDAQGRKAADVAADQAAAHQHAHQDPHSPPHGHGSPPPHPDPPKAGKK